MPEQWNEVASDPEYRKLSPEDQLAVQNEYFTNVVAADPDFAKLTPEDQGGVRNHFMSQATDIQGKTAANVPFSYKREDLARKIIPQFTTGVAEGFQGYNLPTGNILPVPTDQMPQPEGAAGIIARGLGTMAPDLPLMHPFFRVGNMAKLPALAKFGLQGVGRSALGGGMFEFAKEQATGKSPLETAQRTAEAAAVQGAFHGAGQIAGKVVPEMIPFTARKIPFTPVITSMLGGSVAGAGMDLMSGDPRHSNALLGAAMGLISPHPRKGAEAFQKDATRAYREVLRPSATEIKDIELRVNQKMDDIIGLAAAERLPITSMREQGQNKLDTLGAVTVVDQKLTDREVVLDNMLQPSQRRFSLEDLRQRAKRAIKSEKGNAADEVEKLKDVDTEIDAEIERNGGNPLISAVQMNKVKRGMWSKGYNANRPTSYGVARRVGHIARVMIEAAHPNQEIKTLNSQVGQYVQLKRLLQKAHGKNIEGGRISRWLARLTGAHVGGALPINEIPIVGQAVGFMGGEALHEGLTSPEYKTARGKLAAERGGMRPPQIPIAQPTPPPTIPPIGPLVSPPQLPPPSGTVLPSSAGVIRLPSGPIQRPRMERPANADIPRTLPSGRLNPATLLPNNAPGVSGVPLPEPPYPVTETGSASKTKMSSEKKQPLRSYTDPETGKMVREKKPDRDIVFPDQRGESSATGGVSGERIVSEEAYRTAQERMKQRTTRLNTYLAVANPEVLMDMITIGAHKFESGVKTYESWRKAMGIENSKFLPHLPELWKYIQTKSENGEFHGVNPEEALRAVMNKSFSSRFDKVARREVSDRPVNFHNTEAVTKLFKSTEKNPLSLAQVVNHPELFSRRPDLKGMNIYVKTMSPFTGGHFTANKNAIVVNKRWLTQRDLMMSFHPTGPMGTILHEIQRRIQLTDGMAEGSSVSWLNNAKRNYKKHSEVLKDIVTAIKLHETKDRDPEFYRRLMQNGPDNTARKYHNRYSLDELQKLEKDYKKIVDVGALMRKGKLTAEEIYNHSHGEAEARDVELRMNMSYQNRQGTPPMREGFNRQRRESWQNKGHQVHPVFVDSTPNGVSRVQQRSEKEKRPTPSAGGGASWKDTAGTRRIEIHTLDKKNNPTGYTRKANVETIIDPDGKIRYRVDGKRAFLTPNGDFEVRTEFYTKDRMRDTAVVQSHTKHLKVSRYREVNPNAQTPNRSVEGIIPDPLPRSPEARSEGQRGERVPEGERIFPELKMKGNPDAFKIDRAVPLRTRTIDGQQVSKFTVNPVTHEIYPSWMDESHAEAIRNAGSKLPFDEHIRFIVPADGKYIYVRPSGNSELMKAFFAGDRAATEKLANYQKEYLQEHFPTEDRQFVVAGGGSREFNMIENARDLPSDPYKAGVDEQFIHTNDLPMKQRVAADSLSNTSLFGGSTMRIDTGSAPAKGYVYAPEKTTERRYPLSKGGVDEVLRYINDNEQDLLKKGLHLGLWVSNGTLYMDVVRLENNFQKAVSGAMAAHQKAIHNLSVHEDVPVGVFRGGQYKPIEVSGYDSRKSGASGSPIGQAPTKGSARQLA